MSSWELAMHKFLDNNTNILRWSSEPTRIKYIKPTDNKIHHYLPDYYVEYIDKAGKLRKMIAEIKPHSQAYKTRRKSTVYEDVTRAVNYAKWEAAQHFCIHNGFEFQVITEKHLFGK